MQIQHATLLRDFIHFLGDLRDLRDLLRRPLCPGWNACFASISSSCLRFRGDRLFLSRRPPACFFLETRRPCLFRTMSPLHSPPAVL